MEKMIAGQLVVKHNFVTFEPKNHHTILTAICDVHPLAKTTTTIHMPFDPELADDPYAVGMRSQASWLTLQATALPSSSAIKKRTPSSCSRYSSLSLTRGIGSPAYSSPSSSSSRLMAN
jgi:hypothetical protein